MMTSISHATVTARRNAHARKFQKSGLDCQARVERWISQITNDERSMIKSRMTRGWQAYNVEFETKFGKCIGKALGIIMPRVGMEGKHSDCRF